MTSSLASGCLMNVEHWWLSQAMSCKTSFHRLCQFAVLLRIHFSGQMIATCDGGVCLELSHRCQSYLPNLLEQSSFNYDRSWCKDSPFTFQTFSYGRCSTYVSVMALRRVRWKVNISLRGRCCGTLCRSCVPRHRVVCVRLSVLLPHFPNGHWPGL